jgi:hypothetical protein
MSKLWLDDTRKPPWGFDLWAKTADEAISMLQEHEITHVSLDHDLAEEHYAFQYNPGDNNAPPVPWDRSKFKEKTGYAVIEWMATNNRWVPDISIHSLSTGAEEMLQRLKMEAPAGVQYRRVKPYREV